MNDLIVQRMAQIYHDMGWDIPLEDFALAQPDEGQPDVLNMEQLEVWAPIVTTLFFFLYKQKRVMPVARLRVA
jgi:hypothetical protein